MAANNIEDGITQERIKQLEEAVMDIGADLQNLHHHIKDMQTMIIKIATNQQQLAERVAMWPYVKVDTTKKRRPPPKPIDE
jgi:hypothetical protein